MKTKVIASICAGIALVASIVAVNTWLDLRQEREVNAARRERQIEFPLPAVLPAAPPPAKVAASTPPDTAISTEVSSAPSPAMNGPINDRLNSFEKMDDMLSSPERMKAMLQERLKDPDYQKSVLSGIQSRRDTTYPDLAQDLGLSRDEAERLFELLANDQLARMLEGSVGGGPMDAQSVQERDRVQQEFDRRLEESIRSKLGDRFPQWLAYEQTLPARREVGAMSRQLVQAGMPLSSEQMMALKNALIAEQKRQVEDAKFMPQSPPSNPADPAYLAQREESLKRRAENDRLALAAVAPFIDTAQLEALRKRMERDMSESQMALRRQAQRQPAPVQ